MVFVAPDPGDPVSSNNCVSSGASSTTTIADLVVSKGVAPNTLAAAAETITYSLVVRNDGPDQADSVRLTDTINAYIGTYDGRPATTLWPRQRRVPVAFHQEKMSPVIF